MEHSTRHIDFKHIQWHEGHGFKNKRHFMGNFSMRIAEFYPDFVEEFWCKKGHYGYVIEGEMYVRFEGEVIHYKKGDGIAIPAGEAHRHKAMVDQGKFARLVLFESID